MINEKHWKINLKITNFNLTQRRYKKLMKFDLLATIQSSHKNRDLTPIKSLQNIRLYNHFFHSKVLIIKFLLRSVHNKNDYCTAFLILVENFVSFFVFWRINQKKFSYFEKNPKTKFLVVNFIGFFQEILHISFVKTYIF